MRLRGAKGRGSWVGAEKGWGVRWKPARRIGSGRGSGDPKSAISGREAVALTSRVRAATQFFFAACSSVAKYLAGCWAKLAAHFSLQKRVRRTP